MPKKANKALILVVKTWDFFKQKISPFGIWPNALLFIAKAQCVKLTLFSTPLSQRGEKPHCHLSVAQRYGGRLLLGQVSLSR